MRLVIVSHVAHWRREGRLWAYGPYAAEIDQWAALFDEVVIVAPEGRGAWPGDLRPLRAGNVRLAGLQERGGAGVGKKLRLMAALPVWMRVLWREMRQADVVQVRCPGNVGLAGATLAPLAGRPHVAKYAGRWGAYGGEPWSFAFQRWLLGSWWWRRGVVLAYIPPEEARGPVAPMFNSAMGQADLERARRACRRREAGAPWRVLFVGRLTAAKGAEAAIRAAGALREHGRAVGLDVIGEGPERQRLEELVRRLGLERAVRFHGGMGFERLLGMYEQADLLVLPSLSEGWPKVLVEAMAFGIPCVATRGGLTDWMLGEGRGETVSPNDPEGLARALARLMDEPEEERRARQRRCREFGLQYSIEGVRAEIVRVLRERMGVAVKEPVEAG